MANPSSKYDNWTREDLIARLSALERPKFQPIPKASEKAFDFASHSRRKIALKFCYSGWEYGGLAYQNVPTPLPTVEGVLFDALVKARLIDPADGLEGCGWEKCGRTDRGVSAAGQVISLWVRSALKTSEPPTPSPVSLPAPDDSSPVTKAGRLSDDEAGLLDIGGDFGDIELPNVPPSSDAVASRPNFEHDYLSILNRLLPPTIRVLAWSPVSTNFSARFTCTYRHYKYFFSAQGLDIPRMREAASRLLGEHDFRNLCKLDPAKQITIFRRRILRADIEPVSKGPGDIYVLDLVGTAFLYHQVRHILAVLFLVGTGLEHPSVVSSLMNITPGAEQPAEGDSPLHVVDRKPEYQMADALPLVLWECGYPEGELDWRTSATSSVADGIGGMGSELYHQLHSIETRSRIYTTLDQHFLAAAEHHHPPPPAGSVVSGVAMNLPLGGGTFQRTAKYVKLVERKRMDDVSVTNERWRSGKGARQQERRRELDKGNKIQV